MQFENPYTLIILFGSLFMLLSGYLSKSKEGYLMFAAGWALQGIFWVVQTIGYLDVIPANAVFTAGGVVLFFYLSLKSCLLYQKDETRESIRFISGMVFISAIFYYLIDLSDAVTQGLIRFTAWITMVVLNALGLFGGDAYLGTFRLSLDGEGWALPIRPTGVSIILACTAIQAIVVFVAAVLVTKPNRELWKPWADKVMNAEINLASPDPQERKKAKFRATQKAKMEKVLAMTDRQRLTKAFMISIPVIFVFNILRNLLIIYLSNPDYGAMDFDFVHEYLGKGMSFIVLVWIASVLFDTLPEIQEYILDIFKMMYDDIISILVILGITAASSRAETPMVTIAEQPVDAGPGTSDTGDPVAGQAGLEDE